MTTMGGGVPGGFVDGPQTGMLSNETGPSESLIPMGPNQGDRIRTCDLRLPKPPLYQAELRPELIGDCTRPLGLAKAFERSEYRVPEDLPCYFGERGLESALIIKTGGS